MIKCESCQYEHNHASNERCQQCKNPLPVFSNVLHARAEALGIPVRDIALAEVSAEDMSGLPSLRHEIEAEVEREDGGEA